MAKTELMHHGVQDLSTAIAVAENLIDYSSQKESSRSKEKKGDTNKARGDHSKNQHKKGGKDHAPSKYKDKGKHKEGRDNSKPRNNCFLCDGSHWIRDCLKRKVLNVMTTTFEEQVSEGNKDSSQVGSMQLLNVFKALQRLKPKDCYLWMSTLMGRRPLLLITFCTFGW